MKCILLLTLVALCCSAPRDFTGQGNVQPNQDGSITITEPNGKQVTVAKVQGITGQTAIVVSASAPNIPTKTVQIVTSGQPGVLSNIVGQQQVQNLLNAISSAAPDDQLDESVLEVLEGTQGLNSLQNRGIVQNLLQKQASLQQMIQLQLSNINPVANAAQWAQVIGVGGGLGQVPVNQQVLPDGTVISQLQNGLVTIGSSEVTDPSVVGQMGQIAEQALSSGSSWSRLGEQQSIPQIVSEVVQKEREILQVQTLLQQQQLQLQQRQQVLQIQQAQQNAQQQQLEQVLQQQLQENPIQQQVLNQNSVQNSWQNRILQELAGVSGQNPSTRSQWNPAVMLTQGTSGIPVQRLT